MEWLFWGGAFLVVYTYALYPFLLMLVTSPRAPTQQALTTWPSVDVVLSAYNEESCITARIDNLLSLNYPGTLHIYVASDGSTDQTASLLQTFSDNPAVTAMIHSENRGKVTVLNELVAHCSADFVVFTDANTEFEADTVQHLISSFTASTGAVCGELKLYNPQNNENRDSLYWRYEQFLKKHESSLGALLGANGAVYAIRRSLYRPLPTSTVVDDFCIVMNIKKQGFDVVYTDAAVAHEEVAPTLSDEYGRRVRIGLGNYRAFLANMWALSPHHGILAWCYWSHKVLRWFAPHLMLIVFVSSWMLAQQPMYFLFAVLQLVFYAVALYGLSAEKQHKKVNALVAIVSFFVSMNVALGHGFLRFLKGGQQGSWKRTAR
ncbi:glycosyltransferase family 2 protein [Alteromonas oceanisediminis]|uniref:glycosyltransferase family 2 protein n=1 Tax=Alteromonas oceanisediminis TaxID=2836180 RepID=UPI001BDA935C|nr:glycosyltransferase family 2 protein [Alteromonas oceanisediminis]MBT0585664.1 glycosyltransferase family 2 protein [Alteromonas oceanisediminis]